MKPWLAVKTAIYALAGILVLIFNNQLMGYVGYLVGSTVMLFGVNIVIISLLEKKYFGNESIFFGAIMHFIIGAILFIVAGDIVKICVVWAVWSILREEKELTQAVSRLMQKKPGLINAAESVLIMVFSLIMVVNPSERHAHFHVYLLGIELILEVMFPFANFFIDKHIAKKAPTERK